MRTPDVVSRGHGPRSTSPPGPLAAPPRRGVPGRLCRLRRRGSAALCPDCLPALAVRRGTPPGVPLGLPSTRAAAAAAARVVRAVRGRRAERAPRAQVRGRAPAGRAPRCRDRGPLGGGRGRRRPAGPGPDPRGAATPARLRPGGPARRRGRGGPADPGGRGARPGPRDDARSSSWGGSAAPRTWRTRFGCRTRRARSWRDAGSCSSTTSRPPARRSSRAPRRSWRQGAAGVSACTVAREA